MRLLHASAHMQHDTDFYIIRCLDESTALD